MGGMGGREGREGGTYSHVGASADEGIGHGVDELPTDTKVTQLDLSQRVDQDVGWLHIWGAGSVRVGGARVDTYLCG